MTSIMAEPLTLADIYRVLDEVISGKLELISAQLDASTAAVKEEINNLAEQVQRGERTMNQELGDVRESIAKVMATSERQTAVSIVLETELDEVKVKKLSET